MQQPVPGPRKIIKARAGRAPGRVARIDLADGRCAFGRQLTGMCVEFYDLISQPGAPVDLIEIVAAPVAFKICGVRWQPRRCRGAEGRRLLPGICGAEIGRRSRRASPWVDRKGTSLPITFSPATRSSLRLIACPPASGSGKCSSRTPPPPRDNAHAQRRTTASQGRASIGENRRCAF